MYWNTRIPRVAAQIRDQAIMVAVETGALQFSKGLARWVVVPGAEDRRVGCRRDAHDLRYGWRDESTDRGLKLRKMVRVGKSWESNWYGSLIVCVPGSTADDSFRKTR